MALFAPRILSVCSGAGALDLGVHVACADARTVCYVEIEAYASAVLVARMQEGWLDQAPIWSNLKTFDGSPWRGKVDCITGGYPCQPFSLAGSRKGHEDERHLWPHIARIIKQVSPTRCFFENVRGHIGLGFDQVGADLQQMGYRVAAGIFAAREVRASHLRERLFIMADREGGGFGTRGQGMANPSHGQLSEPGRGTEGRDGPGSTGAALDDPAGPRQPPGQPGEGGALWDGTRRARSHRSSHGMDDAESAERGKDVGQPAEGARGRECAAGGTEQNVADADGSIKTRRSPAGRNAGRRGSHSQSGRSNIKLADTDATGLPQSELDGQSGETKQGLKSRAAAPELHRSLPSHAPGPSDDVWKDIAHDHPEFLPAHSGYDRFCIALRNAGFAPNGDPLEESGMDEETANALRPSIFQAAAKLHLRGMADGVASQLHRVDRLRTIGNGVDILCGAYAYRTLDARLAETQNDAVLKRKAP